MENKISLAPKYRSTMNRLEELKRNATNRADYWVSREINSVLGYPQWAKFEPVIKRASAAFKKNGIKPSNHIVQTSKLMEVGRGAKREGIDYFLSRAACYLIAINGDPNKPEIAAAQAYFAVQTRRIERYDALSEDEKRIELRDKVTKSFNMVSKIANDAGVRNQMQAIFHNARYLGLYNMSSQDMKAKKGLRAKDNFFDRAGPLELSANEFQMNLAANVIQKEGIRARC